MDAVGCRDGFVVACIGKCTESASSDGEVNKDPAGRRDPNPKLAQPQIPKRAKAFSASQSRRLRTIGAVSIFPIWTLAGRCSNLEMRKATPEDSAALLAMESHEGLFTSGRGQFC